MRSVLLALVSLSFLAGPLAAADEPNFNGATSYEPANGYDAPIFRQFAFVEGRVTQYHVLKPDLFRTDHHRTNIYQFPACFEMAPVLQAHAADHDAPTRRIVDVVLRTGCAYQPRSEWEALSLAMVAQPRDLWVNAPKIPAALAGLPDDRLYNGPPFRPRITAWEEGVQVAFITYETSWSPLWLGTNFPAEDADVFIISYGPLFKPGFTILNVAAGTPLDLADTDPVTNPGLGTWQAYSPIWRANCIADPDTRGGPVCNSVTRLDPGYYQCKSVAECLAMTNSKGHQVVVIQPPEFTHINCPMVAVDSTLDDHIQAEEELDFPDLWTTGPVIV